MEILNQKVRFLNGTLWPLVAFSYFSNYCQHQLYLTVSHENCLSRPSAWFSSTHASKVEVLFAFQTWLRVVMNQKWAAIDFNCLGAEVEKKHTNKRETLRLPRILGQCSPAWPSAQSRSQAQFGTLVNNWINPEVSESHSRKFEQVIIGQGLMGLVER